MAALPCVHSHTSTIIDSTEAEPTPKLLNSVVLLDADGEMLARVKLPFVVPVQHLCYSS